MIEAALPTMASFATDAAQMAAQAGPPTDLPANVPGFVSEIMREVGQSAGQSMDGLGETISELTSGGSEAAGNVDAAANASDATTGTAAAGDAGMPDAVPGQA